MIVAKMYNLHTIFFHLLKSCNNHPILGPSLFSHAYHIHEALEDVEQRRERGE